MKNLRLLGVPISMILFVLISVLLHQKGYSQINVTHVLPPSVNACVETFSITVKNTSNSSQANVSIEDVLPTGITYVTGSISGATVLDVSNVGSPKFSVGTLSPNASKTISFKVNPPCSGANINVPPNKIYVRNASGTSLINGGFSFIDTDVEIKTADLKVKKFEITNTGLDVNGDLNAHVGDMVYRKLEIENSEADFNVQSFTLYLYYEGAIDGTTPKKVTANGVQYTGTKIDAAANGYVDLEKTSSLFRFEINQPILGNGSIIITDQNQVVRYDSDQQSHAAAITNCGTSNCIPSVDDIRVGPNVDVTCQNPIITTTDITPVAPLKSCSDGSLEYFEFTINNSAVALGAAQNLDFTLKMTAYNTHLSSINFASISILTASRQVITTGWTKNQVGQNINMHIDELAVGATKIVRFGMQTNYPSDLTCSGVSNFYKYGVDYFSLGHENDCGVRTSKVLFNSHQKVSNSLMATISKNKELCSSSLNLKYGFDFQPTTANRISSIPKSDGGILFQFKIPTRAQIINPATEVFWFEPIKGVYWPSAKIFVEQVGDYNLVSQVYYFSDAPASVSQLKEIPAENSLALISSNINFDCSQVDASTGELCTTLEIETSLSSFDRTCNTAINTVPNKRYPLYCESTSINIDCRESLCNYQSVRTQQFSFDRISYENSFKPLTAVDLLSDKVYFEGISVPNTDFTLNSDKGFLGDKVKTHFQGVLDLNSASSFFDNAYFTLRTNGAVSLVDLYDLEAGTVSVTLTRSGTPFLANFSVADFEKMGNVGGTTFDYILPIVPSDFGLSHFAQNDLLNIDFELKQVLNPVQQKLEYNVYGQVFFSQKVATDLVSIDRFSMLLCTDNQETGLATADVAYTCGECIDNFTTFKLSNNVSFYTLNTTCNAVIVYTYDAQIGVDKRTNDFPNEVRVVNQLDTLTIDMDRGWSSLSKIFVHVRDIPAYLGHGSYLEIPSSNYTVQGNVLKLFNIQDLLALNNYGFVVESGATQIMVEFSERCLNTGNYTFDVEFDGKGGLDIDEESRFINNGVVNITSLLDFKQNLVVNESQFVGRDYIRWKYRFEPYYESKNVWIGFGENTNDNIDLSSIVLEVIGGPNDTTKIKDNNGDGIFELGTMAANRIYEFQVRANYSKCDQADQMTAYTGYSCSGRYPTDLNAEMNAATRTSCRVGNTNLLKLDPGIIQLNTTFALLNPLNKTSFNESYLYDLSYLPNGQVNNPENATTKIFVPKGMTFDASKGVKFVFTPNGNTANAVVLNNVAVTWEPAAWDDTFNSGTLSWDTHVIYPGFATTPLSVLDKAQVQFYLKPNCDFDKSKEFLRPLSSFTTSESNCGGNFVDIQQAVLPRIVPVNGDDIKVAVSEAPETENCFGEATVDYVVQFNKLNGTVSTADMDVIIDLPKKASGIQKITSWLYYAHSLVEIIPNKKYKFTIPAGTNFSDLKVSYKITLATANLLTDYEDKIVFSISQDLNTTCPNLNITESAAGLVKVTKCTCPSANMTISTKCDGDNVVFTAGTNNPITAGYNWTINISNAFTGQGAGTNQITVPKSMFSAQSFIPVRVYFNAPGCNHYEQTVYKIATELTLTQASELGCGYSDIAGINSSVALQSSDWSGPSIYFRPSSTTILVDKPGTYTATIGGNCPQTASVEVVRSPLVSSFDLVCNRNGNYLDLTISNIDADPTGFTWTKNGASRSDLGTGSSVSILVSELAQGDVIGVLEPSRCDISGQVTVDINDISKLIDAPKFAEAWEEVWTNDCDGTIHTWSLNDNDAFIIGDFDGIEGDELLTVSSLGFATLQSYDTDHWTWMWSNMGSRTISNWNFASDDKFYVGDFNGDGKEEILVTNPRSTGNTAVVLQWSTGQWYSSMPLQGTSYGMAPYRNSLVVGNFDEDDSDEIIGLGGWNTMFHYAGANNWTWGWSDYGQPHSIRDYSPNLVAGDYDGDGKDELLGVNVSSTRIFNFENANFVDNGVSNNSILPYKPKLLSGKFRSPNRNQVLGMGNSGAWMTEFYGDNLSWGWSTYAGVPRSSTSQFHFIKTGINNREQLMEVMIGACGERCVTVYNFKQPREVCENIRFKDAKFKAKLIAHNPKIDTDGNGEITKCEAAIVTSINVNNSGIVDLAGIEWFTGLTALSANYNQIVRLDLSSNTALKSLSATNNILESINLSQNSAVTFINIQWNRLTQLDLAHMSNLESLYISGNRFASFSIVNNSKLKNFYIHYNLLTSLDMRNGNNTLMTNVIVRNNPDLTCINVSNVSYANSYWSGSRKDSQQFYSLNCGASKIGVEEVTEQFQEMRAYPDPFMDVLTVEISSEIAEYTLLDATGRVVMQGVLSASKTYLDTSELPVGAYILKILSGSDVNTQGLIKN